MSGRGWFGDRERHSDAAKIGHARRKLPIRKEKPKGGVWWSVGTFHTEKEAEARAEELRLLGYDGEPMHAKVKPESDGLYTVYRKRRKGAL